MTRPVAPHGIDAIPRHAVVCAVASPPPKPSRGRPRDESFMDVLLLPADEAARECEERGGYTRELADRVTDAGLRLVFSAERPGHMGVLGRGATLGAVIDVCEGGIVLPGAPPPVPYQPGEAEAYPFAFLVGLDGAIRHFGRWRAWAFREGIDAAALHRYVWRIPPAPAAEWFAAPRTEAELREAGFGLWTGPPDPEKWPGEHRLWLLRAEWAADVPEGTVVTTISGKTIRFTRREFDHPDAEREGFLPVGLLRALAPGEADPPFVPSEGVCPTCGEIILLRKGTIGPHNSPGWTKGSRARAARGDVVRPTPCPGAGQPPAVCS